jgi:CheY-like chemotaxis protein
MRILAVDDDPLFRDLLSLHLVQLGYRDFRTACSGLEGLDLIKTSARDFDCCLIDIKMKSMDGIELVRRIRAIPRHASTPILMVSALTDRDSINGAFLAGANDYITKPLDPLELEMRLSMTKRIIDERQHAQMLYEDALNSEEARFSTIRFDELIPLDGISTAIQISSLENYLLKQGCWRLRHSCAVGLNISRAEELFGAIPAAEFHDLLIDVASAMAVALATTPHLICYLGCGEFVAVLPHQRSLNIAATQAELDLELLLQRGRSRELGELVPNVHIGPPARIPLLPICCPTDLISRARRMARWARQKEAAMWFQEAAA